MKQETHNRLVNWAYWCRAGYLPADFWVGCESAESAHMAAAGVQYETSSERLTNALKTGVKEVSEQDAVKVELAVLRLPDKQRKVLRLHYVSWRDIPRRQKLRILGVSYDGYFELLESAAMALERSSPTA